MGTTVFVEKYTGSRLDRAVESVAKSPVDFDGTLTRLIISLETPISLGTATFNLRINGVKKFFGDDRPKIQSGESEIEIADLDFEISDGDFVSFDLETPPPVGVSPVVYFRYTVVDAGAQASEVEITTPAIADQAIENLNIPLGKASEVFRLTADEDCWIRLYNTSAARTADAGRAINEDPAPGHGCLLDFELEASTPLNVAPVPTVVNLESTRTENIAAAVKNLSGSTATIEITILRLKKED